MFLAENHIFLKIQDNTFSVEYRMRIMHEYKFLLQAGHCGYCELTFDDGISLSRKWPFSQLTRT